ncbi:MAG: hypothetical protein JWM21_3391 [Acidobacteria bacterium]|nr:hypothetical protein [Acidobacteriota bacterium]
MALVALWPSRGFAQACGNPGQDGPGGTLSGVVNTYFPGTGTANAGTTTITVGPSSVSGAMTPVAVGDLLLVMQMQDASINSNNSNSYGDGAGGAPASGATSYNSAGRFEFVVATNAIGIGGGTITISAALTYSYNRAAATGTKGQSTFQVVRVPQYSSATLSSGLTAAPWDGTSGGVLALDIAGNLTAAGTVSLDGLGFRGGGAQQVAGGSGSQTDYRTLATNAANGSKAEGNAGTPRYMYDGFTVIDNLSEGYPNGSFGRGAPGNAGGGGTDGNPSANDENTGGGGGGNGGAGGNGGNSWNSNVAVGGYGGAAFTVAVNRMVLGGGGGAASRNNSSGSDSSGGSGGGMVLIRAGTISGAGTISTNGSPGLAAENDGGGGGGAGGSILVVANSGGLASLALRASGGRGGDAWPTQAPNGTPGERHGPGGGGGGGFVAVTSATTITVSGGANGITTTASDAYGSTPGSAGSSTTITASSVPGARSGTQCVPVLTVLKTTSTPTVNSGTTATYAITTANAASTSDAQSVAISDALPGSFAYASTVSIALNGGATRPTIINPVAGATSPSFGTFTIPSGGSVVITFTVSIPANASGTYQNPATATYLDPKRTVTNGTTTASYNSGSSTGEDVTVTGIPNVVLVKSVSPSGPQLPGTDLIYQIAFSNSGAAVARNLVIKDPIPSFTDFKVGSVTSTLGTTGLTVAIAYSNNGGTTFVYTPVSAGGGAAAGYDRNVTNVRWTFTGNLSQTPPNNAGSTGFTVKIR